MHATHAKRLLIDFSVQESQRRTFFSVFYLCINGGSLLSTIITPILRGSYEYNIKFMTNDAINLSMGDIFIAVHWQLFLFPSAAQDCGIYSQQKCYSLAFGVPAALMVVALGMSKEFREFRKCKAAIHILCTDNDIMPLMTLTVVFIVGSGMYYKAEPQGNIMLDVSKCIGVSVVYTICNIFCINV